MPTSRRQLRRLFSFHPSSVFGGCFLPLLLAAANFVPAVIIRGPIARIPVHSLRHRDTLYVPVAAIARAYGLVLEEDDGKAFVFGSDRVRLRIEAGSREVELNGETLQLEDPVDWREGTLIVPLYLALVTLPTRIPFDDLPPPPPAQKRFRVMLDPGHGGVDPGAVGEGMVREKDLVLEIARTVGELLEEQGYGVILTRNDDRFVSLRNRVRAANRIGVDLFVSIHANAAVNDLAQGTETFYYAPASDLWSRAVAALENAVLRLETGDNRGGPNPADGGEEQRRRSLRAAAAVQRRLSGATRTPNRGIKTAEFYVLKKTRMPSILVETGFLSNRQEREDLSDRGYRKAVAEAIARGVGDYLESTPR